jgi:hypothetical protein
VWLARYGDLLRIPRSEASSSSRWASVRTCPALVLRTKSGDDDNAEQRANGEPIVAASNDSTQEERLLHGYYREHLFMGGREKADIRARMQITAERHGYCLGKVFEEKVETAPAALGALVNAAVTDGAAVVLAGLEHLAIHGNPIELRQYLAAAIARDVLIAEKY